MGFLKRLFGGSPEAPRTNRVPPTVLGGQDNLEVVGESHYQESLLAIVGSGSERVRLAIEATLIREPENPYDSEAVSVWIRGQKVGHLSREDAAEFSPALLELERRTGTAIALPGVIAGGGDGRPNFGVFLNYDRVAFGWEASEPITYRQTRSGSEASIRTGFSNAIEDDESDDDYDLSWQARVPSDRLKAMTFLRGELLTETEPLGRHFMYAQLEGLFYSAREDLASALSDFDATCEAHHAEMPDLRAALMRTFGGLPLLELYLQAAIRHQKAHDWEAARRWAESGIVFYGDDALRSEYVDDLSNRVARYRDKLAAPPSRPRPAVSVRSPDAPLDETLICRTCGRSFERVRTKGRKPHHCPECRMGV